MKVKFLGKGVIWNPLRDKAWCEFVDGEFVTSDEKVIAALRSMDVPEGSFDVAPVPVVEVPQPAVVVPPNPVVPFVDPEDLPPAKKEEVKMTVKVVPVEEMVPVEEAPVVVPPPKTVKPKVAKK